MTVPDYATGPWALALGDTPRAPYLIRDAEGFTIAATRWSEHHTGEAEATARLMVAAPNLLAALKAITPPIPHWDAICHAGICTQGACAHCRRIIAAHRAIAQAEGREETI